MAEKKTKKTVSKKVAPKKNAKKTSSVARKKATTTKTVTRKTTSKISTSIKKSVKKPTNNTSQEISGSLMSWVWFLIAMLFAGLFIGSFYYSTTQKASVNFNTDAKIVRADGKTFVAVKNIDDDFKLELGENQELVVADGKTWIPVPGKPVEVIVVNDSSCKNCNPAQGIAMLRQNVTPALLVRQVEADSAEGKALIEKFDLKTIPQFILADGIEDFKAPTGKLFTEEAKEVLTQKGDKYLVNGARVGLKPGEFLETPSFANLDTEPVKGKGGKIQVVEFTDYQCPFCKRLHDNNKALIDRLVDEGKIEYIVKDFPLGFHAESVSAHKAANCVLEKGGQEKYWKMNEAIFKNVDKWERKGVDKAVAYFNTLAKDLGVDITECVKNQELDTEIQKDQAEGQRYGVTGTPALFIGTKIMPGAIDSNTFEEAVNEQLK